MNNLIEALHGWALDQNAIVDVFTGGVHNTDAPTGTDTALPYLTFTQGDSRVLNVIGGGPPVAQWLTVLIESRDVYAYTARSNAERVRDFILNSGPLSWDGGYETARYQGDGEGGELEEDMGPDGSDVWVHRIPVVFCVTRV